MKLIVLTGLPIKEKEMLTHDLADHYTAQGKQVAVLDNANTAPALTDLAIQPNIIPMRGGCACCSVAGKLYQSANTIATDTDIAIMPANNQTHVDSLAAVLDNLIAGSSTPIQVITLGLVDDRTTCCFPYVAETLTDYADAVLSAPFSLQAALDAIASHA